MRNLIYSVIAVSGVLLFMFSIFNSCKQEETFAKATVETSLVSSISEATATCIGIIIADGGSEVTARGFCWGTSPIPTIENDTTIAAGGTPDFSSLIKGLSPGTTYFVRAYAVNKGGVSYGLQIIFSTLSGVVELTTDTVSSITAFTATSGGRITSDGGVTVTASGVCWSTFQTPTTTDSKTTDGSVLGSFTSRITGLTPSTTYYVRSYATNSVGTSYGNEVAFTTQSEKELFIVGVLNKNMVRKSFNPELKLSNYDRYSIDFDDDSQVDFKFECSNWNSNTSQSCADRRIIDSYSTIEVINPAIELLYYTDKDTIYHYHIETLNLYTQITDLVYNTRLSSIESDKEEIYNIICPTMFNLYDTLYSYENWTNNKFEFAYYNYDYEYRSTFECPSNKLNSKKETKIIRENWNNMSMRYIVFRRKINDYYYLGWIRLEVRNYHELTLYEIVYEIESK